MTSSVHSDDKLAEDEGSIAQTEGRRSTQEDAGGRRRTQGGGMKEGVREGVSCTFVKIYRPSPGRWGIEIHFIIS